MLAGHVSRSTHNQTNTSSFGYIGWEPTLNRGVGGLVALFRAVGFEGEAQ